MQTIVKLGIGAVLLFGPALGAAAQSRADALADLPQECDPVRIGERLTKNLLDRESFTPNWTDQAMHYAEAGAYYGALEFVRLTGNDEWKKRVKDRMDGVFFTIPGRKWMPTEFHVDSYVYGIVPLELYRLTDDPFYLRMGLDYADRQWEDPLENGLTRQTRYWIDDMFMVGALQVQAYRATDDPKYADRGALFLVTYGEKLQQTDGLFRHGNESPFRWGRGNGWVASGMAETLRSLPADHPKFDRLMAQYKKMMAALREHQGEDGMWRQIIDDPAFWPEASCSAMFTFAMIVGVNQGWLDASYAETALKGWTAVCSYLDEDANLTEVCVGTGQSTDRQFYLDRPRHTGDLHGQAPMFWCVNALLRHQMGQAGEAEVRSTSEWGSQVAPGSK